MGLTNAGLNFMYFIFILNIAISIVAAAYPQFSYVHTGSPKLDQSINQVQNANPSISLQWGAYSIVRTFFSNVIEGNYALWRSLGLDPTWAHALQILTYLSYLIVLIAILFGRVL